jgi:malate dehydrogenase
LGVPVVLGRHGIESIIPLELSHEEKDMFTKSASAVKSMIDTLKLS